MMSTSSSNGTPARREWLAFTVLTAFLVFSCEVDGSTEVVDIQTRERPLVTIPDNFWVPQSLTETEEWKNMEWKDVEGCCHAEFLLKDEESVATGDDDDEEKCSAMDSVQLQRQVIGRLPQFTTESTLHVLEQAKKAWNGGSGVWTQMTLSDRLQAMEQVFVELQSQREAIVEVLMWEIGKNRPDAESEFDRTVKFAKAVMNEVRNDPMYGAAQWQSIGTTRALVRRAALGIILCLGPYNYPLNETYAMLIPALLLGNVCLLKIPSVGGLAHLLTLQAFDKVLPPGTLGFVSGPGRTTAPPLMASGDIDGLAFIGGSDVADQLIQLHPHAHRLNVFLQLEANNMAIYMANLFSQDGKTVSPALENALDQTVIGSLSYNGQRCTALKLLMVPQAHGQFFAEQLAARVSALSVGLPWQQHSDDNKYSAVTPLPNAKRVTYMRELLDDALAKGAQIMNPRGGQIVGGDGDSTLMVPAVLYPVTSEMRLFHEEQFGPLVPVATYSDLDQVVQLARDGPYAQQVALFVDESRHTAELAAMVDAFAPVFGKINLNAQCGRSPDTLPFSGRRSSAMGVMSVSDALKEFSTPTVLAYKASSSDDDTEPVVVQELVQSAKFLQPTQ